MISEYYTDLFDVIRITVSKDSGGAQSSSEAVLSSGNRGFIEDLSGSENIVNARTALQASKRLYCDLAIDIRETDKVRSSGIIYGVAFIQRHKLGLNAHQEIYLGMIDNE